MKNLLLLLLLCSCSPSNHGTLPPEDRPLTAAEIPGLELVIVASYVDAEAPWSEWQGVAMVNLSGPELGQADPSAGVSFAEGWHDECFASSEEGTWTYEVGVLTVTFGALVEFTGSLEYGYDRTPQGDEYSTSSKYTKVLRAEGLWTVSSCDDLPAGNEGRWSHDATATTEAASVTVTETVTVYRDDVVIVERRIR